LNHWHKEMSYIQYFTWAEGERLTDLSSTPRPKKSAKTFPSKNSKYSCAMGGKDIRGRGGHPEKEVLKNPLWERQPQEGGNAPGSGENKHRRLNHQPGSYQKRRGGGKGYREIRKKKEVFKQVPFGFLMKALKTKNDKDEEAFKR